MIVDTCIGNDKERGIPTWSNLQTGFLTDLEEAGWKRESVDFVLCTHLHVDHVGWNTMLVDGKWEPTFPNAKYIFGRNEFEFWTAEEEERKAAAKQAAAEGKPPALLGEDPIMVDSVFPVVEAGLHMLVDDHAIIIDEGEEAKIFFEPTHGHTPGHISVNLVSKGETALITGDCMYVV